MHVLVLGLSHRSAPLAIRERLAVTPESARVILGRFPVAGASEAVVLATCGRCELYAAGEDGRPDAEALAGLLVEASGEPVGVFEPYLERRADGEAVLHLFRLATGLDSLVVGESEILGQVGTALRAADEAGSSGPILREVFRWAMRAGRRARSETAIGAGAWSVPSVAVEVAGRALGGLAGRAVLVVGAGEMGELAVRQLARRGAGPVTVLNRTLERASRLAAPFGAAAAGLERLPQALRQADIVVTSTGAPGVVVPVEDVRDAMQGREGRPLVIVDMALPRDVHPAVRTVAGVHYFDLDDLAARAAETVAERRSEEPKVEAIVAEEAERLFARFRTRAVIPTIADLRGRAEAVRRAELERAFRRLPHLEPAQRRALEAFSRSLVKKLLHDPTAALKEAAGNGHAAGLANAVRRLFALDSREQGETDT
jgi:glutamyl-tRNA reductase